MEFQGSFPFMPARATQNPKPETSELHPLGGNNAKFASGRYRNQQNREIYLKNGIDEEAQTHCFPSFSENQIIDFIGPLK